MALFLLAKAALAYFPTALPVARRPLFPFQLAQCAQVFRFSSIFPFTTNSLLSPVLSGYNGSPDFRFSRGMTQLMSWSDGERDLPSCNPLQSLSYSPLSFLGLEASCLIEILPTHRFPRFPPRNLCSLVVFAAMDTANC